MSEEVAAVAAAAGGPLSVATNLQVLWGIFRRSEAEPVAATLRRLRLDSATFPSDKRWRRAVPSLAPLAALQAGGGPTATGGRAVGLAEEVRAAFKN